MQGTGGFNSMFGSRVYYDTCQYWKYDKDNKDREKLVYETAPKGSIQAREIVPHSNGVEVTADFMFSKNGLTLETNSISDISTNDIIKYNKEIWRVASTQKKRIKNSSQYMKDYSYKTVIQITR
jgi:hypothetical protein